MKRWLIIIAAMLSAPAAAQSTLDAVRAKGYLQCGVSVREANDILSNRPTRLALKTSGASNGQTIVGAFATGTRGPSGSPPWIPPAPRPWFRRLRRSPRSRLSSC